MLDGSSSSGSRHSGSIEAMSLSEAPELSPEGSVRPDTLLHTADYVEARGILLPATDYLKHAVDEMLVESMDGDLLIQVRAF